jgi:hypothetical protein
MGFLVFKNFGTFKRATLGATRGEFMFARYLVLASNAWILSSSMVASAAKPVV